MTIYGWDASDFDWDRGSMDLNAARRDGIDFFTHKATESTNVKHKHYADAMNRARNAGIPFLGAYHVVRSSADLTAQVNYLLAYVNAATPWWKDFDGWFFQVDLEKWTYDDVDAGKGEVFADILEQRSGRKAVIYASKGQYGNALLGTSHPLWNANYGNNAAKGFKQLYTDRGGDIGAGWASYSGVAPRIWQYGSNAIIGSQHTCDANAFRGSTSDFAAMIGGSSNIVGGFDVLSPCKFGDKGQAVGALQATLLAFGFNLGASGVDESYGPATASALADAINDGDGKNFGYWEYAAFMKRVVAAQGGAKGDKGDKGDPGTQGPAGKDGAPGTPGKDGKDGAAAVLPDGAVLRIVSSPE